MVVLSDAKDYIVGLVTVVKYNSQLSGGQLFVTPVEELAAG